MRFDTDPKYLWRFCKVMKNKWAKTTPNPLNGSHQESQVRTTLKKLAPFRSSPVDSIPTLECQTNDFLSSSFSFSEFNIALESKNHSSASSRDGIDFEVISRLPVKFKLLLLDIYNEMFCMDKLPDSWKESYVHYIPDRTVSV